MSERTKYNLAQWYHATLFNPVKQTLIQSIKKGYFATQPNLEMGLVNKHVPPSMATSKGHMHQTRNNIMCTKQQAPMKLKEPLMKPLSQCTNTVFTKIIDHKRQTETD